MKKRNLTFGLYGKKIMHRAAKMTPDGQVSALCFKKPHAIDLEDALWTIRDEAVTCGKCAAILMQVKPVTP